jgi:hypothetical protein
MLRANRHGGEITGDARTGTQEPARKATTDHFFS